MDIFELVKSLYFKATVTSQASSSTLRIARGIASALPEGLPQSDESTLKFERAFYKQTTSAVPRTQMYTDTELRAALKASIFSGAT